MSLLQPPGYSNRDNREPLPYWVDVQADLNLCWLNMPYCRFCRVLAHMRIGSVLITRLRRLIWVLEFVNTSNPFSFSEPLSVAFLCFFFSLKIVERFKIRKPKRVYMHACEWNPASILYKSIADRYRPVSYPDGPITARYRFNVECLQGRFRL